VKKAYPNIKFISVDYIGDGLDAVSEGKVFGMLSSTYSAANIFNGGKRKSLKVAGILSSNFDDVFAIATRKNNFVLHSILEKLLLITDPDIINKFMKRGTVITVKPDIDYQRYWIISLLVIVIIFILIYWNARLKYFNKKLEISQFELKEKTKELQVLSITDPLTKTFNRLKMDDVFLQEIKKNQRYHHSLSIFMIDIDHFKNINDQHGHLVGDEVLTKISAIFKNNLRSNDFLGRWGGEEFLVICPFTNLDEVEKVAEKLRKAIEIADFSPVKQITAS